jgi:hypothetical protein
MFYAGIGSRETPDDVQQFMTTAASILEQKGYVLRSGGAVGADKAFECGVVHSMNKEIFLPYGVCHKALCIASTIHPRWVYLNDTAKNLHGRNVYQILGKSLVELVEFVVCWTPKARDVGGTRTAILLARQNDIPVYNLADPAHMEKVMEMLF